MKPSPRVHPERRRAGIALIAVGSATMVSGALMALFIGMMESCDSDDPNCGNDNGPLLRVALPVVLGGGAAVASGATLIAFERRARKRALERAASSLRLTPCFSATGRGTRVGLSGSMRF